MVSETSLPSATAGRKEGTHGTTADTEQVPRNLVFLGSHSSPVSEGSHSPREALRVALVPLGMSQGLMILCELPALIRCFYEPVISCAGSSLRCILQDICRCLMRSYYWHGRSTNTQYPLAEGVGRGTGDSP